MWNEYGIHIEKDWELWDRKWAWKYANPCEWLIKKFNIDRNVHAYGSVYRLFKLLAKLDVDVVTRYN